MSTEKKLEALRRKIDRIDDQIHDLIMSRTEIVADVRRVKKNDRVKIRPAREAEIMYRLMARHKGPFPKRELFRMWREMIVATLSFEGPFSVAVYEEEGGCGNGLLARDQYGSFTKMTAHRSVRRVIEAVRTQDATVGILPLPRRDDEDPWWRHLVSESEDAPKIIARLPFVTPAEAKQPPLEALVICPVEQEPTGRDRSYLAVEASEEIGLERFANAFTDAGMPAMFTAAWRFDKENDPWLYLAEVDGFVSDGAKQGERIFDALGAPVKRVVPLGGYATPLNDEDLANNADDEP